MAGLEDKVWFCPKCGRDRRKPYDENGEMVPCCNPKCGGLWGTGCYCCHHPKFLEEDTEEEISEKKRPLKVYIAGPLFSSGLIDDNIRAALEVGHQIKELGAVPVIPHLFFFWDLIFPRPEEYWLELDRWLAEDSDITFRLEGYSKGANDEEGWSKQIFRSKRELFDYIMAYNLRVYGKKYGDRSVFRCMKIQMEREEDDQG